MPLLSATERIIREAEAAEARKSAAAETAGQASVMSPWAQPTSVPAGALPEIRTEPTFADGYPDYDDLSDGITRVDLNRSALALEKLRAFDAQSPGGGARQAALGIDPSLMPPQRALTAERSTSASASASRLRRGPPPGRPTPPSEASWPEPPAPGTASGAVPDPTAPMAAQTAVPLAEPPLAAHRSRSISVRHSPRVGRRLGLVIAAVTAAAVAPLVGSWTAHFESAASARGGAEALSIGAPAPSSAPAGTASPPAAPVVVPTIAGDPAPRASAPAQRPTLPLEPSGKTAGTSPDSPERRSSSDAGVMKDRLLAVVDPRPAHKSAVPKKSRRRAHQTKVVSTVAAPRAVAPRPAGPSPSAARHDGRASGDPDDTLPIAIE